VPEIINQQSPSCISSISCLGILTMKGLQQTTLHTYVYPHPFVFFFLSLSLPLHARSVEDSRQHYILFPLFLFWLHLDMPCTTCVNGAMALRKTHHPSSQDSRVTCVLCRCVCVSMWVPTCMSPLVSMFVPSCIRAWMPASVSVYVSPHLFVCTQSG